LDTIILFQMKQEYVSVYFSY